MIICSQNYEGVKVNVDFAHKDADAMRKYVVGLLGYREGNVIYIRDATKGELEDTFGTQNSHEGKLSDYVRAGKSDVTVLSPSVNSGSLIGNFALATPVITPNGDAVNDQLLVSYEILAVVGKARIAVDIFDMAGRRVRR